MGQAYVQQWTSCGWYDDDNFINRNDVFLLNVKRPLFNGKYIKEMFNEGKI